MPLVETPPAVDIVCSDDFAITTTSPNGLVVCEIPVEQLHNLTTSWQTLTERCSGPNSFYEPWFLLPAIKHLADNRPVWRIMAVFQKEAAGSERLVGFFPFVESRDTLRCRQLSLWTHSYCFLSTPLVEQHAELMVLEAITEHLQATQSAAVWHLPLMTGEGPLRSALAEHSRLRLKSTFHKEHFARAVLHRTADWQAEFDATISGHHKREYRRQRRKLSELGDFEVRIMHQASTVSHWIQWFLNLEAQGWKAQHGTAIQQHASDQQFFREVITGGAQRNQVQMLGLFLDGEPIAMKCNLVSHPGSFAFKIAYDESLRKYSPGVLLEIENLRYFSEQTDLEWMDSCAAPDHPMINRLWRDRRPIENLLISSGAWHHELALGSLPLLRSLNRVRKQMFRKAFSQSPQK